MKLSLKLFLFSFLFILLICNSINFVSAEQWGYDILGQDVIENITYHVNQTNLNSSEYWDDMDTINTTQMEDNGGVLNILTTWLNSVITTITNTLSNNLQTNITNLNTTYNKWWYNMTTPFVKWAYNQSSPYDAFNYNMSDGSYNVTYAQYSYNQSVASSEFQYWNLSGTDLFTESSAYNVGIGTDSPTGKLTVNGSDNVAINVQRFGNNIVFLGDVGAGGSDGGELLLYNSTSSLKTLISGTRNSYIQGGNVGIGTDSPNEILHISGGVNDGDVRIEGGVNQDSRLFLDSDREWVIQNDGDASLGTADYLHIRDVSGSASRMVFDTSGNVGIGTTSPSYPLVVNSNSSSISIYAQTNISATGFITRTSIFDSSKNVWDYIKDASYYVDNGEINHSKFYGYSGKIETTDISRPETETTNIEVCEDIFYSKTNETSKECHNEESTTTIYPYKIEEEGVSLDMEIDVLRQALFELKTENKMMKEDLCSLGVARWC